MLGGGVALGLRGVGAQQHTDAVGVFQQHRANQVFKQALATLDGGSNGSQRSLKAQRGQRVAIVEPRAHTPQH